MTTSPQQPQTEIKEKLILKKSCMLNFNSIRISRLFRSKYSTVWTKRYNLKKVQHDPYLLDLHLDIVSRSFTLSFGSGGNPCT